MAVNKVQAAENRSFRLALLVTAAVVVGLVAAGKFIAIRFPGVPHFFALLPKWLLSVLGLLVGACLIALLLIVNRAFERRSLRSLPATPVALWAASQGWDYKVEDDLEDGMWHSPDDRGIFDATDVAHGRYQDREAWAFTIEGGSSDVGDASGQYVALRLKRPFPGELEASRVKKDVGRFPGGVRPLGRWFVSGDVSGDGTEELLRLLAGTHLAGVLDSSGMPSGMLVRVPGDEGRFVAAIVKRWDRPDAEIPQTLAFLGAVAAELESVPTADDQSSSPVG